MQAVSRYRGFIVKMGARGHCGEADQTLSWAWQVCPGARLQEEEAGRIFCGFHLSAAISHESVSYFSCFRQDFTSCSLVTLSVPALPLALPLSWVLP